MTDEELIQQAAEEVMGLKVVGVSHESTHCYFLGLLVDGMDLPFNPLTNLNDAFMVVERMRELGFYITITCGTQSYAVWFSILEETFKNITGVERNKDLGHAICLAALKAVENG